MASAVLAPSLQSTADRFARSLIVPSRLMKLHPRKQGSPGDAAALAPAITLGVLSAFEGFVEDFFATVLYQQGQSFAQIVKKMNLTNPDVAEFGTLVANEFPTLKKQIGSGFSVDVWKPPAPGKSFWEQTALAWAQAETDAKGWMQVRHCLSHGLATGWRSEVWPGPVRKLVPPASSVLRAMANGKHSLTLHGAISCARIYVQSAQHLADLVAGHQNETLSWSAIPDFPLNAAPTK
ncbi:hypothetical protein [Kitasatospora sp. MBT63]|uniref:hypothetical protein n=1 Tax=Kitasatospora sp. MBT63 TaxID=1444768 RepID=UPI0005398D89|nr:hypothetical protein [Kitasatospora sp. MBT63]